ncbi:MAG: carbonic anhydrase family protein [Planctomycetota bacterium]|nr:MAG: carbonic anhydrase family protein [Planctomycetota bacterium]
MLHETRSRIPLPFAALLLLVASSACAARQEATAKPEPAAAHWSYSGDTGPDHWGTLDEAYFAAAKGVAQSPIDIVTGAAIEAQAPALVFTAASVPLTIVNNGHTIEVDCAAGNSVQFGSQTYALKQFHFHSPSEHTLDGRNAALEMHMVHKMADGHAAVVGVLIQEGATNAAFDAIWQHLPATPGPEVTVPGVTIDPTSLLPADRGYYFYDGSLTTPPCTEGIRWFVLKTPIQMSSGQIAAFRKAYYGNNRPVQPHHARIVLRTP